MKQKGLSDPPVKTLSPSEYLKETWRLLLAYIWPLLLHGVPGGEGPGFLSLFTLGGEGTQPAAGGEPSRVPGRGDVPGQGARREKTAKERKAERVKRELDASLTRIPKLIKAREAEHKERGEHWPTEEAPEVPSPEPERPGRKARVVPFPKKAPRKRKRWRRIPAFLLARLRKGGATRSMIKVAQAMYRLAKIVKWENLENYTGKKQGKSLFYLLGNERLARETGLAHATIERCLAGLRIKAHFDGSGAGGPSHSGDRRARSREIIYLRHRGYEREGPSIWELPLTPKYLGFLKKDRWARTRWTPKP